MQSSKIKFTYRDYLLLPEGDRRELIEGDFYVVPSPTFNHQDVVANLGPALRHYARAKGFGTVLWAPFDVVLSDEDVVQPDILYISNERRGIITKNNATGAPDLVIDSDQLDPDRMLAALCKMYEAGVATGGQS